MTARPEFQTLEARIEATERVLANACREAGYVPAGDGRVNEDLAAKLLGIAPGTLANHRRAGTAPPSFMPFGRVTYRLLDLAEWIERARCASSW